MTRLLLTLSGCAGFLTIALGAFGAHALKTSLSEYQMGIWETAIQYQMFHTLAMFICAAILLVKPQLKSINAAGLLFGLGMIFFCGSLFALALGAPRIVGAITPIGGVVWLIAWATLIKAAFSLRNLSYD